MLVAACANDFKHAALTYIKKTLNIYFDIYLVDNRNNIYGYEFHPNGVLRIVENPWYEDTNLFWSNTYDSEDPQDADIHPWVVPVFPIRYSYELKEILEICPIS